MANKSTDGTLVQEPREAAGEATLARRLRILQLLAGAGFLSVIEIAGATGVSEITSRRDLAALEREGRLKRTHGGAIALSAEPAGTFDAFEPAFEARRRRNMAAKQAVARAAAALVGRGETVGIDVGTTALMLAEALRERDDIKVVTNNLRAAASLADSPVGVYVPGGQVRAREHSICGSIAAGQLADWWLDTAFIGVSGIAEDGLFDYSPEDTEIKHVYMRRARRVVVLADSSKFSHRALIRVGSLARMHVLVSDRVPEGELGRRIGVAGVRVIVPSR